MRATIRALAILRSQTRAALARSAVIYRGPSRYDPATTIRAVLTHASANRKTGPMAQLFILHDTIAPQTAQTTGDDRAVCGLCPLRPAAAGGCYVVTCQGPLSVWKATTGAPVAGAGQIAGMVRAAKGVRLGAYGDAAALPPGVVAHLVTLARGKVTGYTHGHRLLGFAGVEHLRTCAMLSVESDTAAREAHARGWRTFRVTTPDAPALPSEITCPSETRGTLCADCLLCRGASLPRARSIVIPAHGSSVRKALSVVR